MESEKLLQQRIYSRLQEEFTNIQREVHLDKNNIIDFLVEEKTGIEIKLQGTKKQIYYQCERYTGFLSVQNLVLVTNKSITLPSTINGKECYTINLSKAWL
jgi:hypothetical protein